MKKVQMDYADAMKLTTEVLGSYGALLVARNKAGKPNVMTIGWAVCGIIWGRPMMLVLVRPSRHTHQFIDEADSFTVNIPPPEMADVATYCGTVSGRDADKFKEKKLTPVRGKQVSSSYIDECVVHFECRIVHKNRVHPQHLAPEIVTECYPQGDYHTIYYGEIAGCYRNEDYEV
jgi:flavin reductase (DIM6/NTAB) family NADH-FMN oxidoreductase RutF